MRDRNWYIETWFPLHFVVSLFGKQIFVIFPVIRPLLAVFGLSVNVCAVINNVWSLLKSGGNSVPCHGIWQLQLANRLPEVWWNLSIADFLAWERIINSFVEQSLVIYRRVWILFGLFNFVFWWICINVWEWWNSFIQFSKSSNDCNCVLCKNLKTRTEYLEDSLGDGYFGGIISNYLSADDMYWEFDGKP